MSCLDHYRNIYQTLLKWYNLRALRTVYPGLHYDGILLAIPSLEERRETIICKLYFHRLTRTEHKLHHILPVERDGIRTI